jgi:PmbA protein
MKKVFEQIMGQLVDQRAEGDLIFSSSKSLKMSAQKSAISTYNVSSSQILGLRVIKDNRVGISYTESLDEASLDILLRQALQNAQISEVNNHEQLLRLSGSLSDEMVYDEASVDISLKTEKALELENGVKKLDSRVVAVPYNSYSENEYQSHYLSSQGRATHYADKIYSITSSALMEEEGKKSSFYDFDVAHRFSELHWSKVIEKSLFHARNLLQEKTIPTGKYNILFSEDCLKSLLECFSNFYSAKSAMDKVNPWGDKLGENVISKDLSIFDDARYHGAFRKYQFDSEGVETKSLAIIEDGVLKSLLHNSLTANFFKTQTTGHAHRSASSSLGVSGTHMIVQGKNLKPLPPKYLEVIQIDGLHSGANRVNGSFSFAIKGYVWENGERVQTFGNVTISGNLPELLKNVEVVSDSLRASTDRSFFSVPLVFYGVSIAGHSI